MYVTQIGIGVKSVELPGVLQKVARNKEVCQAVGAYLALVVQDVEFAEVNNLIDLQYYKLYNIT